MNLNPETPLATQLSQLWAQVHSGKVSSDAATAVQNNLLSQYREAWTQALLLEGEHDLTRSILTEIGCYRSIPDLESVRQRCVAAGKALQQEWHDNVPTADRTHIVQFYDKSQAYIEALMWWHTLQDDDTPLAYLVAAKFAAQHDLKSILDFGCGVGTGAILYGRHGLDVTLSDISSSMLEFCAWRFRLRGLSARFIDLKHEKLPGSAFDLITAMDVFEHLTDPIQSIDLLADALKPGGYIFGRFASEDDPDHPQHIVQDFRPVFARFEQQGFREVWRDDWLWGHQVFQKPL